MYTLKEIVLRNKTNEKKRLVIEFADPKKAIVAEFLMVDAPMYNEELLNDIQNIVCGKEKQIKKVGNRCKLEITKHTSLIQDLYEDNTALPSYQMETLALKELVMKWFKDRQEFYR